MLITQRTAKTGDKRPVSGKVLTLTCSKPQPPRSNPSGAQSALRSSPAQRALLDVKINRQLLEHSHVGKVTTTYVRYDVGGS